MMKWIFRNQSCYNYIVYRNINNVSQQNENTNLWYFSAASSFVPDVILFCFDISNKTSLGNVQDIWLKKIKKYGSGIQKILVGNKSDCRSDPLCSNLVTRADVQRMMNIAGASKYFENSARLMKGQEDIVEEAIRLVLLNSGAGQDVNAKNASDRKPVTLVRGYRRLW